MRPHNVRKAPDQRHGTQFWDTLQICDFMKNPEKKRRRAPTDQALTVRAGSVSDTKLDSSSPEKVEAQSMSYRRSRDVALIKLAFLPPENNEEA